MYIEHWEAALIEFNWGISGGLQYGQFYGLWTGDSAWLRLLVQPSPRSDCLLCIVVLCLWRDKRIPICPIATGFTRSDERSAGELDYPRKESPPISLKGPSNYEGNYYYSKSYWYYYYYYYYSIHCCWCSVIVVVVIVIVVANTKINLSDGTIGPRLSEGSCSTPTKL